MARRGWWAGCGKRRKKLAQTSPRRWRRQGNRGDGNGKTGHTYVEPEWQRVAIGRMARANFERTTIITQLIMDNDGAGDDHGGDDGGNYDGDHDDDENVDDDDGDDNEYEYETFSWCL